VTDSRPPERLVYHGMGDLSNRGKAPQSRVLEIRP
jgi:hypothetical protein